MDTLGINLPEGEDLKVKQTERGVYEVQNAYEGTVEYFKGKPIPIEPAENCTDPGEPQPVELPIVDVTKQAEPTNEQPRR